tara:strand:- start:204 stop:497 length:294 start_codon:yes stop_codon:yes gene_type:complete
MVRYYNFGNGNRVQFTTQEETAQDAIEKLWDDNKINRDLENLRSKRNNLLAETDWWGMSDNTMTEDQTKYRKDLRDLPTGLDTVEKVANVTWPTKPS